MSIKVAINGFGRIGRNVLRAIIENGHDDIEVVAINDLGPVETNAHLLRFDSVHGRFTGEVKVSGDAIDIGRGPIRVTAERDPASPDHEPVFVAVAELGGQRISIRAAGRKVDVEKRAAAQILKSVFASEY